MNDYLEKIQWTPEGLVPAIAQDCDTGEILMMAWMNAESLSLTIHEGCAVYWSRSRNKLWRKGETSGHIQKIKAIHLDCDSDALLLSVKQIGGIACHTGRKSCFYQLYNDKQWQDDAPVIKNPNEIY